jgi:PDZ domain-containing protein
MTEPPATGWDSRWDRFLAWWGFEPPRTPRQRARSRAIRRGLVAGGLLILVGSVVRLPLLILSPGPTYNTIGEVDGQPLIVISGTTTFPTEGNLDMTTVSERGGRSDGVHLGEALLGWASPSQTVVPRESVYGPDVTGEEASERNDQLFALSQSDSIAAAMRELGIPTEDSVVVTVVGGGTPADGIIEAGDVVLTVDGQPVATPADVGELVRDREVGDPVTLEVLRAEDPDAEPEQLSLTVVTAENPDPPGPDAPPAPYLGILVGTRYDAPFDIEFGLENVGGPSAGMMFSLALVDMLTDGPMTAGGHVAGTGTIDPDGRVGPIGGIRQKLTGAKDAGATLFLAPRDNCDEVAGNEPDGLTVVPVGTLDEARAAVERWAADPEAEFSSCESVAAAGR